MPNPKSFFSRTIILAMATLTSLACLESATPKTGFRVAVHVSGYDPSLIETVSGFLIHDLRGFRDVTVADSDADLHLRILVIENKTNVKSFGYTLSILASRTLPEDFLRSSVPDDARRAFLLRMYGNSETLADNWIVAAPPDGLEETCKKIVDTYYWGAYQQAKNPRRTIGEVAYGPDSTK